VLKCLDDAAVRRWCKAGVPGFDDEDQPQANSAQSPWRATGFGWLGKPALPVPIRSQARSICRVPAQAALELSQFGGGQDEPGEGEYGFGR
jgi:hypothetical protein